MEYHLQDFQHSRYNSAVSCTATVLRSIRDQHSRADGCAAHRETLLFLLSARGEPGATAPIQRPVLALGAAMGSGSAVPRWSPRAAGLCIPSAPREEAGRVFIKSSSQPIPTEGLFELGAEPYVWFPAKHGTARGGKEMYFWSPCLQAGCLLPLKPLLVENPLVAKQMWGPGAVTRCISGARVDERSRGGLFSCRHDFIV